MAPPSAAGGAKAALDGYEYQLGVSVLAALRLMLITKSATRITLEPANEEDLEAMERIAYSAKRRALLLLGVSGLADRDRSAAVGLLALLGADHPTNRLLDLADGERLPKTALDDLGHIRFRKAVQGWLDDKVAKD